MSTSEPWTIGRLLQWTAGYLSQRGAETPRLDAEVLLAAARNCRRIDLYTSFAEEPAADVVARFRETVKRRALGTPVAYLVGRREFYALEFEVTPDVLIPRPETEHLLVRALDLLAAAPRPAAEMCLVDVGTGSGAVAICAVLHSQLGECWGLDISPPALAVARKNAARHAVGDRVHWLESDLLAELPAGPRVDLIVSNPPYISTAEYAALPIDVREHEPRIALEAGPTGAEVIARLIPQAAERLAPGGTLLLEISPQLHDAVRQLLLADGRFDLGPTTKDLAQRPRVVEARRREA
jgi:release factor glutamine methyltransferase